MEKIRAVQRQPERLARKERMDALGQKPELEKVVYPEILALCRELKWEIDEKRELLRPGLTEFMLATVILCRKPRLQTADQSKNQNFICFNEDGDVVLFEDDYNTGPTYGRIAPTSHRLLF